jgi:two-component system, cell cycle sensor histidine kinase and response regulator CckA
LAKMHLGEPTLVAVTTLLFVIWAVRGAMLWRAQRNYPGHSRWTAAGLLILAALCLFNMWPLTTGGVFTALANTMAVIAPVLYMEGAREFRGFPTSNRYAYWACAVVIVAVFYFDYAAPSLHLRVYLVSSFMGVIFTLASIQLLHGSTPGDKRRAVFTGCMFALCGAVIMARAIYFFVAQPSDNSPSGTNGIFFVVILASIGGISLGIALLADERAKSDLANAKAEASRAIAEAAERRRSEALLRESEERFRSLADTAPVMIWVSGPDKLCTFFNKPWLDFTGRTMEEEAGNGWSSGVHPEDRERCMEIYATSFEARRSFQIGYRLRRADGQYRWLLDRGRPFYREGEFAGFVGSCIDLTERKRMEERLRASEARFADAQRLAKVGSWERDLETERVQWSGEMYRIFGLPKEAPPSYAAVAGHIHPKDREKTEEADRKVRSSNGPVEMEYRLVRPDGNIRYVRSIVEAIKDDLGTPIRIVGATQDITEQVEARELLRESEECLNRAEQLAHVGSWTWDVSANRFSWSEELFRICGQPETFTPSYNAYLQSVIPQDRDRITQGVADALTKSDRHSTEYTIARPNGELRNIACVSQVLFDEEGLPLQMFGACQDITDFRRAQEEAMAAQKLETVGTLANGIAHDFNNLLGAVLAQSELAMDDAAAGANPTEALKAIRDIAIRGSEIVRQLMIYAGKEKEVPGPVDISKTIEDMIELLRVSVSKNATLEIDLAKELPAVQANAAQISQIVINLVTNASEAIGARDGAIRVTTRYVAIRQDPAGAAPERVPEGDYLKLVVSDTGEGMSPETQARVFDPFFTTRATGRGLGLAVVQGIVRVLSGAIHVDSDLGKGSTFEVLLPCVQTGVAAAREPVCCDEEPEPPFTILVVEDEDPLRQAASKMLRKAGYSVLEAADGSTALDRVRSERNPIDVLLLDVTLPGTPSCDVLEEARRLRPETRVIVTSAHSAEMAAAALHGRFERFIRKPYRLGDLAEMIREELG